MSHAQQPQAEEKNSEYDFDFLFSNASSFAHLGPAGMPEGNVSVLVVPLSSMIDPSMPNIPSQTPTLFLFSTGTPKEMGALTAGSPGLAMARLQGKLGSMFAAIELKIQSMDQKIERQHTEAIQSCRVLERQNIEIKEQVRVLDEKLSQILKLSHRATHRRPEDIKGVADKMDHTTPGTSEKGDQVVEPTQPPRPQEVSQLPQEFTNAIKDMKNTFNSALGIMQGMVSLSQQGVSLSERVDRVQSRLQEGNASNHSAAGSSKRRLITAMQEFLEREDDSDRATDGHKRIRRI